MRNPNFGYAKFITMYRRITIALLGHTAGGLDTYRKGRRFVHVDVEPTQIGRVFSPDFGIVSGM